MSVKQRIGPEAERQRRRRNWSRLRPETNPYLVAIAVAVGFIDGWPLEITREGARAIRRGDAVAEAERLVEASS